MWNSRSWRSFYAWQNCCRYAACRMWMVNHTCNHSQCVAVMKTQLLVGTSHSNWQSRDKAHGVSKTLPHAQWGHTGSDYHWEWDMGSLLYSTNQPSDSALAEKRRACKGESKNRKVGMWTRVWWQSFGKGKTIPSYFAKLLLPKNIVVKCPCHRQSIVSNTRINENWFSESILPKVFYPNGVKFEVFSKKVLGELKKITYQA